MFFLFLHNTFYKHSECRQGSQASTKKEDIVQKLRDYYIISVDSKHSIAPLYLVLNGLFPSRFFSAVIFLH